MVFPTVSYSAKINSKFSSNKKHRTTHTKLGPRHAPNIYDRIAAYDRAFQRCLKQDSKLSSWKKRMDEKGLPAPLIEGYQRSFSSWQHSLSSVSSDSSVSSNDSYTMHRTKNVYDIKPMKPITVSFPTPPPPPPPILEPPMPKPSVSRRIINRLSLSKSTKRPASKVSPTTTQSLQPSSCDIKNKNKKSSYASQRQLIINSQTPPPPSKPSLPRTGRLPPQEKASTRLTPEYYVYLNNTKNQYYQQMGITRPPSPPPSPCGIDNYFSQKNVSQKRNYGVDRIQRLSSHCYHSQRSLAK